MITSAPAASHILTVLSSDPLTTRVPSGETAKEVTELECPRSVQICQSGSRSFSRISVTSRAFKFLPSFLFWIKARALKRRGFVPHQVPHTNLVPRNETSRSVLSSSDLAWNSAASHLHCRADPRDPLLRSERTQGFAAGPVHGRARRSPMLGSFIT